MTPLIYSTLASGVICFALGSAGAWKIQSLRMAEQEKERAELVIESQKIAFRRFEVDQDRIHAAQTAATARTQRLRVAVSAARDELDGLRRTLGEADRRVATASEDAVRKYAATANSVLDQCTRAYLGVAEKAQGHANDVGTLTEAWPKR